MDRGVIAHRPKAVHCVGGDVDQVPLAHLTLLALDHHEASARSDVIKLVGRVLVGIDQTAPARRRSLPVDLGRGKRAAWSDE